MTRLTSQKRDSMLKHLQRTESTHSVLLVSLFWLTAMETLSAMTRFLCCQTNPCSNCREEGQTLLSVGARGINSALFFPHQLPRSHEAALTPSLPVLRWWRSRWVRRTLNRLSTPARFILLLLQSPNNGFARPSPDSIPQKSTQIFSNIPGQRVQFCGRTGRSRLN